MATPKLSSKISDIKPAKPTARERLNRFAARAAVAAKSDNAKIGYVVVGISVAALALHAAQVAITKKILFG